MNSLAKKGGIMKLLHMMASFIYKVIFTPERVNFGDSKNSVNSLLETKITFVSDFSESQTLLVLLGL